MVDFLKQLLFIMSGAVVIALLMIFIGAGSPDVAPLVPHPYSSQR